MTTLTPSLLDSSLNSAIPSIILSLETLAIVSIKLDFFTAKGISEIIIESLPFLDVSVLVLPLIRIEPFPFK